MRVFRSIFYCHVPSQLRSNLDDQQSNVSLLVMASVKRVTRYTTCIPIRSQSMEVCYFDEDSLWDWEKQDVMHISVPMTFEEYPRIT